MKLLKLSPVEKIKYGGLIVKDKVSKKTKTTRNKIKYHGDKLTNGMKTPGGATITGTVVATGGLALTDAIATSGATGFLPALGMSLGFMAFFIGFFVAIMAGTIWIVKMIDGNTTDSVFGY